MKYLSPMEMLFKQKSSYSHLKAFGCLCFSLLKSYNNHKLKFRSDSGTFIGYSNQFKGYKVLLPNSKIVFTRHIVFNEQVFLNLSPQSPSSPLITQTNISNPTLVTKLPPTPDSSHPHSTHHNSETSNTSHSDIDHSINSVDSHTIHPDTMELPTVDDPTNTITNNPSHNNAHPMITRSKAGIFKPRLYSTHSMADSEPNSIEEALSNSKWNTTMMQEYKALIKNKTWQITPLSPGNKLIGCKWIFKIKRNVDGSISRYKARLIAKGFNQVAGIDYGEIFIPVVKPATIRLVFNIALTKGWNIK